MSLSRLSILYRADGGHTVGTGHLLRASRVLRALSSLTTLDAILAVGDDPDGLSYAYAAGVPVLTLPSISRFGVKPVFEPATLLDAVDPGSYDVVVVDMLDTPEGSLESIAARGCVVITMDDRGPGRTGADAIISFLVREPDPSVLPPHIRLYEGPEYATLDESYALDGAQRPIAPYGQNSVLVTLGGADAAGLSLRVARALRRVQGIQRVEFVCGNAYRHMPELERIVAAAPWQSVISVGLPSLKPAFLRSDLAIVAGGLTMHEACCTGTPAVAVCQPIDHQIELAGWFEDLGAMRAVGDGTTADDADIAEVVQELLGDEAARGRMSRIGPQLVDGRGTERTARAILEVADSRRRR